MPIHPVPERIARLRRTRRLVGVLGVAGLAACAVLVARTQRDSHVEAPREGGAESVSDGRPRASVLPGERFPADVTSPDPSPATSSVPRRNPTQVRLLRVRVEDRGVAVVGAVVRAVRLDRAMKTVAALSDVARTSSDGVAELVVDVDGGLEGFIEVAVADTRGMCHGYHALAPILADPDGEIEIDIPPAGRLEIVVEGLPAGKMPPYVDVRFLTPDGGWEDLFDDLEASPIEDGSLFEYGCLPRVERVRLRADGRGAVPAVPSNHGIYVEFPASPDGWLVERSSFSGRFVESRSGEVFRVAPGATGVYRVRYREMPTARIVVEDATGHPISGATVVAGLRTSDATGRSRVFDASDPTDANGALEVPLWTGPRIPTWSPIGLVVAVSAAGKAGRVVETNGGWYGSGARIRLDDAPKGEFIVEGRLTLANRGSAGGIPVRLATAPPWNGHAALPLLGTTTDADGGFRIRVPEAHREILAYGDRLRIEVDSDRLEAQPMDALWRSRFPGLPRATTSPGFALPAPGESVRVELGLDVPPP